MDKEKKERLIKVLKLMALNHQEMADIYENLGDETNCRYYSAKSCECNQILMMITDDNYFEEICEIWEEEE